MVPVFCFADKLLNFILKKDVYFMKKISLYTLLKKYIYIYAVNDLFHLF